MKIKLSRSAAMVSLAVGSVVLAGTAPAQIAFWEDVMRKSAQSDEIRKYAEENQWLVEFKGAAETRKWLDEEFAALKVVMTELGLVRLRP